MENNEQVQENQNNGLTIREGVRRRMMGLFAKSGITDDMRHELVYAWTKGRTNSSSQLELQEMRDLCWKFETHFDVPQVGLYLEAECKKLRAVVLKLATDTGIKEPFDFKRFNGFMMSHSILKKELHKYSLEELHPLVKQFRGLKANFDRSAGVAGSKAWFFSLGLPEVVEN